MRFEDHPRPPGPRNPRRIVGRSVVAYDHLVTPKAAGLGRKTYGFQCPADQRRFVVGGEEKADLRAVGHRVNLPRAGSLGNSWGQPKGTLHGLTPRRPLLTFELSMSEARVIRRVTLTALVLLAAATSRAQSPSSASNDEAAALLQEAQGYDSSGDAKRAIAAYRTVTRKYSITPSAPAAQFRLAELIGEQGNENKAFEAYTELIRRYPQSREFDKAVSAQLAIADDLMTRRRYERAEEMYRSILESAPYTKAAPAAQFKLGQSLESRKEYDKAVAAYQVILDRYGSSDYADDALYQIGYVQFTEARSRSKDLSAAIDAKNTFDEFLMEYPDSEKAAQARENLAQMTGREAGDIYSIAQFYDRNNNYRAAVIYYSDVVRRQPGSEDAKSANARIEEIRAAVGDDELRSGPERAETGERAALRRRLQNQVETSALSNYAGPPASAVAPPEELPAPKPQLRTSADDVQPMKDSDLPPVEPELPHE